MNPFTPGFGTPPSLLIGRESVLADIAAAFNPHPEPHQRTWLRAERGAGKTALLNEIQNLARAAGWLVVQEDADSDGDLSVRIIRRLQRLTSRRPRRQIRSAGLTTPVGGASIEVDRAAGDETLRDTIHDLLTGKRATVPGILITVDEVHKATDREISHFGNAVQHIQRDELPLAAVVAGLPPPADTALPTFFSRCVKPDITSLPRSIVKLGLQETARIGEGGFTPAALDLAADVVGGYPYMLQLVGYYSWRIAAGRQVSVDDVRQALPQCERELVGAIAGLGALQVSPNEDRYLAAMAIDDGPSATSTIAERLGVSASHAGVYRSRLMKKGLIIEHQRGFVDLVVPGHRSRLRLRTAHSRYPSTGLDATEKRNVTDRRGSRPADFGDRSG